MRAWLVILGGLMIWTAHFFGLYAAGEIFGDARATRLIVLFWTLCALLAEGLLLLALAGRSGGDEVRGWLRGLGMAGVGVSSMSIFWQGLAVLGSTG